MPMSPPADGDLAPYACRPGESRGRRFPESESPTRSVFQRDRDRIIHSTAFRRLMHKTQVFVRHEGDHYRTRLTHSLEVAQIARSICRVLGLNEDLAEALALAHDFGHTPFGHAGEEALDEAMAPWGGFDHNAQTLRLLTRLEARYASFDGLNLTWETLEGVVKHNGPLTGPRSSGKAVPAAVADYVREHDLEIDSFPGAEAQVASLADDIAYNNHDIDDGLRAGLFTVADLEGVPLAGPIFAEVAALYPGTDESRLIHESVRRMIDAMVNDLLTETRRRLGEARPATANDIRRLGAPVAAFSDRMRDNDRALKAFLFKHMYRHETVAARAEDARRMVRDLFAALNADRRLLPSGWREHALEADEAGAARTTADFIAGMTDRFAIAEHQRLFNGF